jgi:hypothetical protein
MKHTASQTRRSASDWPLLAVLLGMRILALGNTSGPLAAEVPLNMAVSSTGQIRKDGKGVYRNGTDFVGIWLDPNKWSHMSFDSA